MTAKRVEELRGRLQSFVEEFAPELGRSERRYWCGKYLEGLLREGERKSIEPMAARIGGDEQALQQFVNQSPWEHPAVLHRLREQMKRRAAAGGVLVLADTSLPKQGHHSVGVARQYCGALGKIANCQSIVTWHWAGPGLHWPLAAQLYLPAAWTDEAARMKRAGVPPEAQRFREKWRIALDLLAEMKPQLPAYQAIVFDAGYGGVLLLLAELEKRGEPYVGQVPGSVTAWPADAVASSRRPAAAGATMRWCRTKRCGLVPWWSGETSCGRHRSAGPRCGRPAPTVGRCGPWPYACRLRRAAAYGASPASSAGF